MPGRCCSSPPSTSSASGRCLPESRPKAERFTPVRRRSEQVSPGLHFKFTEALGLSLLGCPGGSNPSFLKATPKAPQGLLRAQGSGKSTPTEIGSGTTRQFVLGMETSPSRRLAPACANPIGEWGAGMGRPERGSRQGRDRLKIWGQMFVAFAGAGGLGGAVVLALSSQ